MTNSKNNFVISFFLFFLLSCSTSSYRVEISKETLVTVYASSDRFLPVCEELKNDDEFYGFMIKFLDEEQTISSAVGMSTSKEDCEGWKKRIQKILDNGDMIKLTGTGDIKAPRERDEFFYTILAHGTFNSNGRVVQLFTIGNEQGECFSMYDGKCLDETVDGFQHRFP